MTRSAYVDSVGSADLIEAAIEGMLLSLDPNSMLLTPDQYDDLRVQLEGSFEGVGITLGQRNGWLTVVSPLEAPRLPQRDTVRRPDSPDRQHHHQGHADGPGRLHDPRPQRDHGRSDHRETRRHRLAGDTDREGRDRLSFRLRLFHGGPLDRLCAPVALFRDFSQRGSGGRRLPCPGRARPV